MPSLLTPTVAQLIAEDRLREAGAMRIARAARPGPGRSSERRRRTRRPALAFIGRAAWQRDPTIRGR